MKRTKPLIMSVIAIGVLGVATSANAQDSTTPPPSETAPPPATHSSSSSAGSISLGGGAGLGLGGTLPLIGGGPAGANIVYDAGLFHIEGLLGFTSQPMMGGGDRLNNWIFGAGGWYHLHRGSSSDFSVGGLISINYVSGGGGSATLTSIEPGANIRAFVTPNVAIFARAGLGILLGDTAPGGGANFYFGSQANITAGFTYFFR